MASHIDAARLGDDLPRLNDAGLYAVARRCGADGWPDRLLLDRIDAAAAAGFEVIALH